MDNVHFINLEVSLSETAQEQGKRTSVMARANVCCFLKLGLRVSFYPI